MRGEPRTREQDRISAVPVPGDGCDCFIPGSSGSPRARYRPGTLCFAQLCDAALYAGHHGFPANTNSFTPEAGQRVSLCFIDRTGGS